MKFGSPAITFVYHLGAHCTDERLLISSLMKNGDDLQAQKIIVPRPKRYRNLIMDVASKYRREPVPEDAQRELFDAILMGYPAERVILSHEDYLGPPEKIFGDGQMYHQANFRSTWLHNLFPENPCEFFLAIRNPATLIPAVFVREQMSDYQAFTQGIDPRHMSWWYVIESIQEANPGCPITVWCNEDTPLIWPTLLREISDADPSVPLNGEFDVMRTIMREDGFARMQSYFETHELLSEIQRRRVFAAFLDKFAIDDALEQEVDLPGWTPELIDEVTARYDDDVYQIERMSGVNFIAT